MKKVLLFLLIVFTLSAGSYAGTPDEGMWLPIFVERLNFVDMQKMGLNLTAEEIYSINNSSMKDAIVNFGNFCTAEVVSPDGLLLTNHHCGYDAIQTHSSIEHDYLTDGFWAMSRDEELKNDGIKIDYGSDPKVKAGLTGVNAGVAETGTIVLTSGAGHPSSTSLLPDIHIAVLHESDIHKNLPQVFKLQEIQDTSSYVLISGPSRTADIEMTLTIGVHGPGELHVFCLAD